MRCSVVLNLVVLCDKRPSKIPKSSRLHVVDMSLKKSFLCLPVHLLSLPSRPIRFSFDLNTSIVRRSCSKQFLSLDLFLVAHSVLQLSQIFTDNSLMINVQFHSCVYLFIFFFCQTQGAQEMFQELPHIYVEPHELKKASQSTGMSYLYYR